MGFIKVGNNINRQSSSDGLGNSVSISKDETIIAVGGFNGIDSNSDKRGYVKLHKNNSGTWSKIGSGIYGENVDNRFGYNVSLADEGSIISIKSLKNISSFCFANKIFDFRKGSHKNAEVFI